MILCKIPTRTRPEQVYNTLKGYIEQATNNSDIIYLICYDVDDPTMNSLAVNNLLSLHENVVCMPGRSANKVQAYNRDVTAVKDWDILIASSDDMICVYKGWDEVIRKAMKDNYPDTDGVLHFNDGYVGERLNTLPILGRKYYERFNYVYHPDYISLWCDNHFMEVATRLKKQTYFDTVLFKHEHYANNSKVKADALMQKNESYYGRDKIIYEKHKKKNFDL